MHIKVGANWMFHGDRAKMVKEEMKLGTDSFLCTWLARGDTIKLSKL